MSDIRKQYSRIDNKLYRRYLDYDISKEEYDSRKNRINKAYDKYERNIARQQGVSPARGVANYSGFDNNTKYSRAAYAGSNG